MTTTYAPTERSATPPRRATMRAIRLAGPGLTPRLEHPPVPRPMAGQALLRVLAAGVCHTDLQLLDGTLNPGVWPITPGHEVVGEVVALGPDTGAVRVGTRALVYYTRPCGECAWCTGGHEQVCPNAGPQPGLSADGGFAEYLRVPVASLVELPPEIDSADAAPLACAAATAYHALHAVAAVQAGETVVVYGIGGVGLALIQLARLAGARVIAVGRSPEKLEAARVLGAEVVDGVEVEPALAVRRLTGGEGAHAVFDLVGSAATMDAALAMPRRRGCLVLVGYGAERLALNPLHLVLRETRLLGSLSNTRAELVEVVRLAASGKLRLPIAARLPLESAASALVALRAGALVGRAVLLPGLEPAEGSPPLEGPPSALAAQAAPGRREPARVEPSPGTGRGEPAAARVSGAIVPTDPQGGLPGNGSPPFEAELLAFVGRGVDGPRDDAEFDDLARRLFAYQFDHNAPYRALCERRGRTPFATRHWRDIPAVPIAAFKETLLTCEPVEGAAEFNSSGTTRPEHKSRHFHPSLKLYDLNARLNFQAHVLPDREQLRFLVLFPTRQELPHSSLAHWLTLMVESFGTQGSDWYVTQEGGLDADRLAANLRTAERSGEPVGILAASFGLVHFLERALERGEHFQLPAGSRVMDTGGYKGRSREYPRAELYQMVVDCLGVPERHIVNMYGMTEHGTQFLDAVARHAWAGANPNPSCFKVVPPWARTLVVDPLTMREVQPGKRGLLLHVDLVNRASVLAVLSEDVGFAVGEHEFELIGRAEGAEARGCSIALDELIQAVGGAR